ncbi:histidine phosphatase family protein [Candidatus Microgenomates bacterium]|nr:histidine phosphatase family protein [Candidatus Microgenomates bacterium]
MTKEIFSKELFSEEEKRRLAEELIIKLRILRHGESTNYGEKDALLTERGKMQMRQKAAELANEIKSIGRPGLVPIYCSERRRTEESANIIYKELKKIFGEKNLWGIKLYAPKILDLLTEPANIVDELEKGKKSTKDALDYWYSALEEELAKEGIPTPLIFAKKLSNYFDTARPFIARSVDPEIYFGIFVTHENSLGALIKHYLPEQDTHIAHGDILRIDKNKTGNITLFRFRKEYSVLYE